MKLFQIQDDEGPLFVLARDIPEAVAKWRAWIIDQSDGALSKLDPAEPWPDSITKIADEGEVIR